MSFEPNPLTRPIAFETSRTYRPPARPPARPPTVSALVRLFRPPARPTVSTLVPPLPPARPRARPAPDCGRVADSTAHHGTAQHNSIRAAALSCASAAHMTHACASTGGHGLQTATATACARACDEYCRLLAGDVPCVQELLPWRETESIADRVRQDEAGGPCVQTQSVHPDHWRAGDTRPLVADRSPPLHEAHSFPLKAAGTATQPHV
jgi:hypothetical protein